MVGRYPASLSRRPPPQTGSGQPGAGPGQAPRPRRPASPPSASSSIDDEVPAPPEFPPIPPQQVQPLPELASLEYLLRQAGYKETRVFTPESERTKPRLKTRVDDDESDLANMYAAMGLDPDASIQVRHLTHSNTPLRSSSSVLRNVALQDATAMLNEVRRRRGEQGELASTKDPDSFWRPDILDRAAAEAVGRNVAAISPPRNRNSTDGVGLGLAQQGRGVRKAKSNMELVRRLSGPPEKEDIPPASHARSKENPPAVAVRTTAFKRDVPPSIASMFSPPTNTLSEHPQFVDDAFNWGQLPSDYESQEADDEYAEMYATMSDSDSIPSGSSAGTSLSGPSTVSLPLLDTEQVLADLGLGPKALDTDGESLADADEIAQAEAEAAAIGQRILASTIEYDDDEDSDEFDPDASPTPKPPTVLPLPVINVMSPSPPNRAPMLASSPTRGPRAPRRFGSQPPAQRAPAARAAPPFRPPRKVMSREDCLAEAMSESIISPPKISQPAVVPASPLRASKSVPALRRKKSLAPFAITPAALAAPALRTVSPVVCDSVSNAAEDLPPLPIPPMAEETGSGFGSLALRAKQSLGALRASFWASAPEPGPSSSSSTTPILAPRLDWSAQGAQFAGWNSEDEKTNRFGHHARGSDDSTSSVASMGTVHELGDPFEDNDVDIDYTKSFFYKPTTPPKPFGAGPSSRMGKLNKQASVKSLRRALLIPVAPPPVPKVPSRFLSAPRGGHITPPSTPRLKIIPPEIHIHSPGAFEEGRAPRPLSLEGEEWEGHDVIPNWGEGVRRKRKGSKRLRKRNPFEDDFS